MNTLETELRGFVVENFLFGQGGDTFTDEDSFLQKGIVDSTGIMEVIAHLEETYEITVEDEELLPENLDSVARLASFVRRKREAVG
ncbi:MAG: acyl carrier protein [Planctomycetota bacterium]|jgi:acyl carrier protein|nr:acyl carrier protein [Planctomycetota bacterium]MDP6368529.1 acyl carrier protein [Planctomycetota bacterium]MDP6839352.1 acyl carrier protein [Planctomycetota bacterium]